MVKIIGYYVVFKGNPDTRRPSIRLPIEQGVQCLVQFMKKENLLIRGSGYSYSGIDAVEKIIGSDLDVQRELRAGHKVLNEDELKTVIHQLMQSNEAPQSFISLDKPKNGTQLPPGIETSK